MLNRITLTGRLTRDPVLRQPRSGIPVASFSQAVNRNFKDKVTGETPVDFIDIVAWRHVGEFVAKYFTKGRVAVVDGRLQIRDWTDKEGNKRRVAEVVANDVYFGDSAKRAQNESGPIPARPTARGYEADSDRELPF